MCLFPNRAIRQEFGRPKFDHEGELRLPCGKCTECIKKRAIEWAQRAKHEIATHNENCFLTLTYDEEHLPSNFIIKDDFQNFLKRIRKTEKIRYIVSYEYGSQTFRPHMHAILFGFNPPDQKFLKRTKKGEPIFTAPFIERHWGKGFHSIGTANEKTAYYIASYALKGKKHQLTHPTTGEISEVCDTMDASKRPAIGYEYLLQNAEQLINSGEILPRYYLKKMAEFAPDLLQKYEDQMIIKLKNRSDHENLAKFVIDQQKLDQSDSEYRKIDLDTKNISEQKLLLKDHRDNFVALTKGYYYEDF